MNYTKISIDKILEWLKANLDEKRFNHSVGTAECAKMLAEKFNLEEDKAYIAGLLHDCAKCFSNEKLLDIINSNLPDVSDDEKASYKTLHAPVSAYVSQIEFGVTDNEIISSIRWHTIGQMNMTDFEKVIFLADKIETKTRKPEYRDKIAPFIEEENGLNKAIFACYKETIKSLCERNLRICPLTIDIYNKLLNDIIVN
jgi:predicted HD superfamily hydrolase involved in NAD metabolism